MSEQVLVRLTGEGWANYCGIDSRGKTVSAVTDLEGDWFCSEKFVLGNGGLAQFGTVINDSSDRWGGELVANPAQDSVNHPSHYTTGPKCECGRVIECITITRRMMFSVGNAMKYLWRAGKKGDASLSDLEKEREDVAKAEWYCRDRKEELDRLIASKKPDES